MRARFVIFTLLFILAVPFSVRADDKADASAFVTNIGKQALAVITSNKPAEDKNRALEKMFVDNVDIDWIGKYVVGRAWKSATDEQKRAYMASYKDFILSHYTSNFADFTNANFEVTRVIPDESGGNTVTMRIKRLGAEDIVVDYTIRKDASGALKVYDITVEGVSMITTQRSDFTSVISQNGFDYLISQLKQRTAQQKQQADTQQ